MHLGESLPGILVTGGTGLLGWHLVNKLPKDYQVIATYHTNRPPFEDPQVKWIYLDLVDHDEIKRIIEDLRPEIVIHTAAYTDVDGCETDRKRAFSVNYLATKSLIRACQGICEYFIYISTDYVFDGEKGYYSEEDLPCPVNYYGLTKLLGEVVTANLSDKSLIIRTSGIYGCSPGGKKGFALNLLEKLSKRYEVTAFTDQYLSPTYAPHLASNILELLELRIHGFLHIAGDRASRYDFAIAVARELGADEKLVKSSPMDTSLFRARRPRDSSLDTKRAKEELGLSFKSMRDCIREFIRDCGEGNAIQKF